MGRVTVKVGTQTATVDYTVSTPVPPVPPAGGAYKKAGGLSCASVSAQANVAKYGCDRVFYKIPAATVMPTPTTFNFSELLNVMKANSGVRFTPRIQFGGTAPQWLKDATGEVMCRNSARGIEVQCAKWWTPVAIDAYQRMIAEAGRLLDGHPQVVQVSATLPTTVFSEPYLAVGGDKDTALRLFDNGNGLDQAKQTATIKWCVDATAAAFPTTLVELAMSGMELQFPTATGVGRSKPAGRQIALDLIAKHGKHLILTDYGLGVPDTLASHLPAAGETMQNTDDVYTFLYLHAKAGGRTGYQLTPNGATTAADYQAMGKNGADLGAISNETSGWLTAGAACDALDDAYKANEV